MTTFAERKRQFTRDAIVAAAEELFSQRGYHNTQIMDIVKAVGMSAGTFYKYFKDKRDLFAQITRASFSELRTRIREVRQPVDIWDRDDRIAKLNETFAAYFDYIEGHRQQYLIQLRGSYGVDEEFDDDVWSYYREITQDLAEDIQVWKDLGVVADLNPDTLACAVVGMTLHLGHTYLMGSPFTRAEAIETLTAMSNMMFESYLTEAGRTALQKIKRRHGEVADEQR
jgi:AcrR family transcriptional regulator